MKKLLIILSVFLLTGCSNELTCKLNKSEEEYDVEQKIVFNMDNDDKVIQAKVEYTMIFKTEEEANSYLSVFENIAEDYNIDVNKNKLSITSIKNYEQYEQSKDALKMELENDGYVCK